MWRSCQLTPRFYQHIETGCILNDVIVQMTLTNISCFRVDGLARERESWPKGTRRLQSCIQLASPWCRYWFYVSVRSQTPVQHSRIRPVFSTNTILVTLAWLASAHAVLLLNWCTPRFSHAWVHTEVLRHQEGQAVLLAPWSVSRKNCKNWKTYLKAHSHSIDMDFGAAWASYTLRKYWSLRD